MLAIHWRTENCFEQVWIKLQGFDCIILTEMSFPTYLDTTLFTVMVVIGEVLLLSQWVLNIKTDYDYEYEYEVIQTHSSIIITAVYKSPANLHQIAHLIIIISSKQLNFVNAKLFTDARCYFIIVFHFKTYIVQVHPYICFAVQKNMLIIFSSFCTVIPQFAG